MGTSQKISPGVKGQPQWSDLSRAITYSCDGSDLAPKQKKRILKRYVSALGGANNAGRGGSNVGGKAGIRTLGKIGSFFSDYTEGNLTEALQKAGLESLQNKPINQVFAGLLDYFAKDAAVMDDIAARAATEALLHELLDGVTDFEEIEEKLNQKIDEENLNELFHKFITQYIHEHLSTLFNEKLVREKNVEDCNKLFEQIKDFIKEELITIGSGRNLQNVNWNGDEGSELIKNIYEDVLKVFENYED